ncbi:capsular polysaccharide export protein, LipB/KpsS family [Xanthobacter sediminis]
MVGEESAANAALLARTAGGAGFAPAVVPFWSDAAHAALVAAGESAAPVLLDGGFDAAPRLSAFAFRARHGFSPDLIELSAHSLAIGDARIDNLHTESVWNQQLRGAADRAIAVIGALRPDVVFVPHGAEVLSRLLAEASAHLGIPYLYWESPFFPGYHFVDPYAPHFFPGAHRIDRTWSHTWIDRTGAWPAQEGVARAADFIARIRAGRITKYRQESAPEELDALRAWLSERPGPVLFVPGQIAFDASVTASLRDYPDLGSIYRAVFRAVPEGWRVIFKPHPREPDADHAGELPAHVRRVRHISIHDIFPLCDVVGLQSSNVGLEALMAGRPVVAWGDPYYGRKGLTFDIADGAQIGQVLAAGPPAPPDPAEVAALVGHVLEQGLVREGDAGALLLRVAEASAAPPGPRLPWYGAPIRRLAAAGRALDAALAGNGGMAAALKAMPRADRMVLEQRFGARALREHDRGPPRLGFDGRVRRLGIVWRFSTRLGGVVRFDALDLQAVHDPEAALGALAARARRAPRLLLLRRRAPSGRVIQQIGPRAAEAWLAAAAPELMVDVFGWSGTTPLPEAAETGEALLLLRPAGAVPLTPEDRAALTRQAGVAS